MSAESSPRPSSPPGQAVAAQHLVLRHDPAFVLRFSGERSICGGTTLEAHAHSVAPQSESATAFAPHATRSGWVPTPSPCLSDCPLGPGGPGPCGTFLLAFQWDWDSGTLGLSFASQESVAFIGSPNAGQARVRIWSRPCTTFSLHRSAGGHQDTLQQHEQRKAKQNFLLLLRSMSPV